MVVIAQLIMLCDMIMHLFRPELEARGRGTSAGVTSSTELGNSSL